MIQPRFATMFCFVQTDAELAAETLDLLTGVCVKRSFDRISVDGQLSTSDTVFALANGASGVRRGAREPPTSCASARRSTRCCASSRSRSWPTARGCRRVGRIVVEGRPDAVEPVARSDRQLAARQDRAARRRPQLRPHPAGGRGGLAAGRPVRRRPGDRGPPAGLRRRRHRAERRRPARARAAGSRRRGRVPARPARAARRRSSSRTSASTTPASTRNTPQ